MDDMVSAPPRRKGRFKAAGATKIRKPRAAASGVTVKQEQISASITTNAIVDRKLLDLIKSLAALFFDEPSYIDMYHDLVLKKESNPAFDAAHHFAEYGRSEGRSPSYFFDVPHVVKVVAKTDGLEIPPFEALSYFEALPTVRRFVPNKWFNANALRILYSVRFPEIMDKSDYNVFIFYLNNVATSHLETV